MTMRTATLERRPVPASTPPDSASNRLPVFLGLDGLRAIAVVAVMFFHLTPGAWPGGFIGVDIFFVISGFLITSLLLRERDLTGHIRLGEFWRRRARRLLPALIVVVLVSTALAWAVGGDVLVGLRGQVLGAATFSSNWLSVVTGSRYFDSTAPDLLRNLWSLGIEEQFYLVWPLLIVGLSTAFFGSTRVGRRLRLLVVGALAAASALSMLLLYHPGTGTSRVYYGTDTHSFPLLIGALLAISTAAWPYRALGWSRLSRFFTPMLAVPGIVGLVIAFCVMNGSDATTFRGGLVAVAICTALLIAGCIVPGSWVGRMLDAAGLRWIGVRSYGLYLWHWPLLVLVESALPSWPRSEGSAWAMGGIALVLTVGAAMASYRFIEGPIRRRGVRASIRGWIENARSGWRSAAVCALVIAVAAASVAASVAALTAPPPESSAHLSIERGLDAIAQQPSSPLQTGSALQGRSGPTSGVDPSSAIAATPEGSPASGPDITAIGDSVMLASAPALQDAFPGIQIDAVVSRQLREAPAILRDMVTSGTLRSVVVIGLGTNGPIDINGLIEARQVIGPKRSIVVVDVQAPRGWTDGVNQTLSSFADRYRNVEISAWRESIAGQLDLLSGDQIHPGPRGGAVYASALTDALQRLSDIPAEPVRTPRHFE